MLSAALRAPDVHDEDPSSDHGATDDGLFFYGAQLCEECGCVEVGDQAASCAHCAPVYEVANPTRPYYIGRNLRRAFEAQSYLHAAGHLDAIVMVWESIALDFDGLSKRESALLDAWTDVAFLKIHTCIAPTKVLERG